MRSAQRSANTRNIQFWHPPGFWSFSRFRDFDVIRVFRRYQESRALMYGRKTCLKSKLMCYKIALKPVKPYSASRKQYFDVSKDRHIWDTPPLQLRGLSARRVPPGLCVVFMLPEMALRRRSELVDASKTRSDCICAFLNHLRWSTCLQHSA